MDSLGILLPVFNEEIRLRAGVERTVAFVREHFDGNCVITIVDNGSTDHTRQIAEKLCLEYPEVKYLCLSEKGVGIAFQNGVKNNECGIVGYMDIDLSTDIRHLLDVCRIFESNNAIDIVNGSRQNKKSKVTGRKWYRKITSKGLSLLLKVFLGMKATDAICGFKFFRKEAAERLILAAQEDYGWFYIVELIIRAERMGMGIYELPVHWRDDCANSTVNVIQLIRYYCKHIFLLRKRLRRGTKEKAG